MNNTQRSIAPALTLSVRVSPSTRNKLEKLSNVTHRTKSYLAAKQ